MRLARWLLAFTVLSALGLTALVASWSGADPRAGLALTVDVPRDGRHVVTDTARASLPTQRTLDTLRYVVLDQPFRATWEGIFLARTEGPYIFTTVSDDGSWVWVNDVLVVDNGGMHGPQRRTGSVRLTPGAHRLRIGYEQHGGGYRLDVRVGEPGVASERIDALALQLSPDPLSARARTARWLRQQSAVAVVWSWFAVYLAALFAVGLGVFRRVQALVGDDRADWRLAVTLGLLAICAVPGVMWGLPAEGDGWAPDEVSPRHLLGGLSAGFRAPWGSLYPPLAFYVWTPVVLIVRFAGEPYGLAPWTGTGAMHLHLGMRLVSVLMGTGALASVYLFVRQWFGRAEALVAVWMAGLGVCFLYYTKTANVEVPYLYWLMLAFVLFGAVVRTGSLAYLPWLATTAALAVCTKDQAAGYFLLMLPMLPVVCAWHAGGGSLGAFAWRRTVWRREWLDASALALGILVVVYQASWPTFAAHLEVMRAGRYQPMVPPTAAGQLQLVGIHVMLLAFMVTPPVAGCALAGLVLAARRRQWAWLAVLLVPVASYLFGFLATIRYTYDRFLLAVAVLVACAAAPVVVQLWCTQRCRLPARAALVMSGLWLAGHALTVPLLMRHDSRYAVEDYLADHADATEVVGLLSAVQYLPRLDEQPDFPFGLVPTLTDVQQVHPHMLLVNTSYAKRFTTRAESAALMRALHDGSLGYVRVLTHRSVPPWWALAWHWPYFHDRASEGLTNLDKINPEIEVWERGGRDEGTKELRN